MVRQVKAIWVICAGLALAGCVKEASNVDRTVPDRAHRKPRLEAPALFAYVPADTPYLVGSFEAMPLDYLARWKPAMAPYFAKVESQVRNGPHDNQAQRLALAFFDELDGKWNVAGLESVGLSTKPRFAFYGLGVLPAVLRVEIGDGPRVLATIDRIVKRAGATLPPPTPLGDRHYWRVDVEAYSAVISINVKELVLAVGPRDRVTALLPVIVGTEKPAANLADGQPLRELMDRFSYKPYVLGVADSRQLGLGIAKFAGVDVTSACAKEIEYVASRAPSIWFGNTELSAARSTGEFVVELAPDLEAEIEAAKTEIPALSDLLSGTPIFAVAAGVDLGRAQVLGQELGAVLLRLGDACGSPSLSEAATTMSNKLSGHLPSPFDEINSIAFALHELAMPPGGGMPEKLDGFVMVASKSAVRLFDAMRVSAGLAKLGLEADGALHSLVLPLPLPFEVAGGVGERAIVIAVGQKSKQIAERVLSAPAKSKAPLLAGTLDQQRVSELQALVARKNGKPDDGLATAGAFGRSMFTVDVDSRGLVLSGSVDTR